MIFTISYFKLLISALGLCGPDTRSLERCGPSAHLPQRVWAIFHSFSFPKQQGVSGFLPVLHWLPQVSRPPFVDSEGSYTPTDGVSLGSFHLKFPNQDMFAVFASFSLLK